MNRSSEGGWEAYQCDRFAVGAEIPNPHTSPVGDSPNALYTYPTTRIIQDKKKIKKNKIPNPHTSPVGESPNALHTYILYLFFDILNLSCAIAKTTMRFAINARDFL